MSYLRLIKSDCKVENAQHLLYDHMHKMHFEKYSYEKVLIYRATAGPNNSGEMGPLEIERTYKVLPSKSVTPQQENGVERTSYQRRCYVIRHKSAGIALMKSATTHMLDRLQS